MGGESARLGLLILSSYWSYLIEWSFCAISDKLYYMPPDYLLYYLGWESASDDISLSPLFNGREMCCPMLAT
jgi:hypothetical protein